MALTRFTLIDLQARALDYCARDTKKLFAGFIDLTVMAWIYKATQSANSDSMFLRLRSQTVKMLNASDLVVCAMWD